MDKEEAERLAETIRKAPGGWIQVRAVEYNPLMSRYEIKCMYRRNKAFTSWKEVWIRCPRDWVNLLRQRSDGLEFLL